MKRLCRWLFNVLAAMSLLLWVAMAVIWALSYRWAADFRLPLAPAVHLTSRHGDITVLSVGKFNGSLIAGRIDIDPTMKLRRITFLPKHEFVTGYYDTPQDHAISNITWDLALHDWFLFFLLAAPAVCCAITLGHRRRRMRRIKLGLCLTCGYDLRATPDRCPECGTVPKLLPVRDVF